jgi:hypothetical protein
MKTNNPIVSGIAVLGLGLLIYILWLVVMPSKSLPGTTPSGTVCTMEAMQCPDGSWVGRSGPECTFVCAQTASTTQQADSVRIEAGLNQRATAGGVTITPRSVVEDSRCPEDVQCIQAGTVRVRAMLKSGLGLGVQEFTLNIPVTTEAETVTLVEVLPKKISTNGIQPSEYMFVFMVAKR